MRKIILSSFFCATMISQFSFAGGGYNTLGTIFDFIGKPFMAISRHNDKLNFENRKSKQQIFCSDKKTKVDNFSLHIKSTSSLAACIKSVDDFLVGRNFNLTDTQFSCGIELSLYRSCIEIHPTSFSNCTETARLILKDEPFNFYNFHSSLQSLIDFQKQCASIHNPTKMEFCIEDLTTNEYPNKHRHLGDGERTYCPFYEQYDGQSDEDYNNKNAEARARGCKF